MENIQINGQKIWGPPKGWVGPPPPHGTEVFIKNISDDIFEDELYYLFSTVGTIYEVRLPVHWTGNNKGYAFVRYTKISEADAAIEKLNQFMIRHGREIRVERSLDNTRLFLSSVPNDKTGEEIKSDLLTVVENVKTVYVYPALENPSTFRGYAFVEFVSHRDAAIAKRILIPDVLFNLFERKCIAAWANPLPFLSKETLEHINILFMRNIPSNAKSISIRMAVDLLISPDSVHKVKRLNDYAFLTFKNHDIAERAMMKMKSNPLFLGSKAIHVEWAIPREHSNLFSTKTSDLEKDDEWELNFEPKTKNCQSFSKTLEDYKNDHSQFLTDGYTNFNLLDENTENIPLKYIPNTQNIRILQRSNAKLDLCKKTEGFIIKPKSKQYEQFQYNANSMNDLASYMRESFFNYQNISNGHLNTERQGLMSEFRCPDSEDHYRHMHLKNWLQSLTLTSQQGSCATSPTMTSSSTGSSTNLSWKRYETFNQFSTEKGVSSEYDDKASIKNSQQFRLF